ncbi:MAG: putative Ig domain-containing protein, partial [Acidobacteriota bacterium]|nr:putative Ig domain-containing protein [Acidobacteriota bacterium]
GTPTAAFNGTVNVTATDTASVSSAAKSLNLTINPQAGLTITTSSLTSGQVGIAYSQSLNATGGSMPYNWSATGLPTGLQINARSGLISGTPTVAGTSNNVVVNVTDSSNPTLTAMATFSLTIQPSSPPPASGPPIAVTSLSIGQNLQALVTISIQQAPATGSGGVPVTLTSSDPTKVLLNSPQGPKSSITVSIPENQTSINIFVQGLAIGTANIVASASGFSGGTGTVTVTPSGFVLVSAGDGTSTVTTNQGAIANLTLFAARLDSSGNFVENQAVRTGDPNNPFSVSVNLNSSNPGVGTITPSVTFTSGDISKTVVFTAAKTNSATQASTTLTAGVPAGFSTPAGTPNNTVTAFVNPIGCTLPNVTVGRNLETTTHVTLSGSASGSLPIIISSSDSSKVLLANNATDVGSSQITVTAGANRTPDFYVFGIGAPGNASYTANTGSAFGSCTGTVTVAPSGFIIGGPSGPGVNIPTGTGSDSAITISSELLDSSLNIVGPQAVAGGITVNVNVTSSNPSVGTITTSPVTFNGGQGTATTLFHPVQPGSTTLTVATPATPPGFSTPTQFKTVTVTVQQPALILDPGCKQAQIGFHLESACTITLSQPAPNGLTVTLATTSNQLLISSDATLGGSKSLSINIAPNSTGATVYLQSLASSGTATFTATAPGYNSGSGTATFTPAGVIILGPNNQTSLATNVGVPAPVNVYLAQLDPNTNAFVSLAPLAGGMSLSVSLDTDNHAVGTIASPITIAAGALSTTAQFTPLQKGMTTITVATPAGFATSSFNSVAATVSP